MIQVGEIFLCNFARRVSRSNSVHQQQTCFSKCCVANIEITCLLFPIMESLGDGAWRPRFWSALSVAVLCDDSTCCFQVFLGVFWEALGSWNTLLTKCPNAWLKILRGACLHGWFMMEWCSFHLSIMAPNGYRHHLECLYAPLVVEKSINNQCHYYVANEVLIYQHALTQLILISTVWRTNQSGIC